MVYDIDNYKWLYSIDDYIVYKVFITINDYIYLMGFINQQPYLGGPTLHLVFHHHLGWWSRELGCDLDGIKDD